MKSKSYLRGDLIEKNEKGEFIYSDTKEPVIGNYQDRPCGKCGEYRTKEGHDPCLGELPGLMNACCGHGIDTSAYAQYLNGSTVNGEEALEVFKELKNGSKR